MSDDLQPGQCVIEPLEYHRYGYRVGLETVYDSEGEAIAEMAKLVWLNADGTEKILLGRCGRHPGETRRYHLLFRALAAIFNAGAPVSGIVKMLSGLRSVCPADTICPEGFDFVDLDKDTAGPITLWHNDDKGLGLIVQEDLFSETITSEKFGNYLQSLAALRETPFDTSDL